MVDWKRMLVISIGWGLGTAVGLTVLAGGFLWYQARPKPLKPPKPWNTFAIKAEYDKVDTEGDKNTILIYYTLENTTDFDYRIQDNGSVTMTGKLEEENSLIALEDEEKFDYPIFVPSKKRVRIKLHFGYPSPLREKLDASPEERKEHRKAVEKYLTEKFGNLNGFDMLDETNRYEIILPAGWKHSERRE